MAGVFQLKFRWLPSKPIFLGSVLSLLFCQEVLAAQYGIVTTDEALIYADEQMTSPIGFVRKGKKVKVGDIARNRAQVYPIIVSGKIAYIKVLDVNTQVDSVESNTLVAERFQKNTESEYRTDYSISVMNYATQINVQKQNYKLKDNDSLNWTGVSLRGGFQSESRWDFDLMVNYLQGKEEDEVFRMVEFGPGGGLRILDAKRWVLRLTAQLLLVPFASYSVGNDFRVNGYGMTAGGGAHTSLRLGKYWGLEAYAGMYYTRLAGFTPPSPYKEISPAFIGTRIGGGLNYQF